LYQLGKPAPELKDEGKPSSDGLPYHSVIASPSAEGRGNFFDLALSLAAPSCQYDNPGGNGRSQGHPGQQDNQLIYGVSSAADGGHCRC
jgi:hypothetical protein